MHFRNYAPEKIPYAMNRYAFEAQRHFGILDARLAKQKYMLGDTYTIVDMNVWGWARLIPNVLGEGGWAKFPNLKRWSTRSARGRRRRRPWRSRTVTSSRPRWIRNRSTRCSRISRRRWPDRG